MIKELESNINNSLEKVVKLNGNLTYDIDYKQYKNKVFPFNGLIDINHSNVIIDGSNSTIKINIYNLDSNDYALFYIHADASNVEIRNLNIQVKIINDCHINGRFMLIFNTARYFRLINSNIRLESEKQANLFAVYNYSNSFTNTGSIADDMLVDNNIIDVYCKTNEYPNACSCYGVYNDLANTINVTNNHIYSTLNGNCYKQQAVGVYTSGCYGRFIGNNIKASGLHPEGLELEQASSYGLINDGHRNIITSNNVIAEWSGKAIGIENRGEETLINSNKILSTHTVFGRCIRNYNSRVTIDSNMLLTTSKNARIVEHIGCNSIINNNIMRVSISKEEAQSGCGIYAANEYNKSNTIMGNIIINTKTCGLFINNDIGIVKDNHLGNNDNIELTVLNLNERINDMLDEKHIKTIVRK